MKILQLILLHHYNPLSPVADLTILHYQLNAVKRHYTWGNPWYSFQMGPNCGVHFIMLRAVGYLRIIT